MITSCKCPIQKSLFVDSLYFLKYLKIDAMSFVSSYAVDTTETCARPEGPLQVLWVVLL